MGYKYEVSAWVVERGIGYGNDGYTYKTIYTGDSLIAAILAMIKAKKTSHCIKLEWR